MLKMRLQRIGRKNSPSYRVIVTDSRNAASRGLHVDLIGSYDPRLNRFEIDGEKVKKWIGNGVQVSDTVHNLLVSKNVIEGKKINALPRKSPIIDEAKIKAEAEAKAKEEAAAEAKAKEEAEAAKAAEETPAAPEEVPATPEAPTEVPEPTPAPVPEETPEAPVEEPKAA